MAKIKYFPGFADNAFNENIFDSEPVSVSSTRIVQELGGYALEYTGQFVLGGDRFVKDGTVTGLNVLEGKNLGVSISNLRIDANAYLDAIESNSGQPLFKLLFGGNDKIFGSGDDDYMEGGGGKDVMKGFGGADELDGGAGKDKLIGGGGADALYGGGGKDKLLGGGGKDYLNGGGGRDVLKGGGGDDYLDGRGGNDKLLGGGRNDYLDGASGKDRLDGGSGNDALWGGNGADVFVFRSGGGSDTIGDFEAGRDRIDISQSFQSLEISDSFDGVHVSGDGWDVTISNVSIVDLTAADFI